jgi:hypothetical protein
VSNPLSKLVEFFRIQMSGAPVEHVEAAVAGIEKHVEAEISDAAAPTPAAPAAADPAAEAPAAA